MSKQSERMRKAIVFLAKKETLQLKGAAYSVTRGDFMKAVDSLKLSKSTSHGFRSAISASRWAVPRERSPLPDVILDLDRALVKDALEEAGLDVKGAGTGNSGLDQDKAVERLLKLIEDGEIEEGATIEDVADILAEELNSSVEDATDVIRNADKDGKVAIVDDDGDDLIWLPKKESRNYGGDTEGRWTTVKGDEVDVTMHPTSEEFALPGKLTKSEGKLVKVREVDDYKVVFIAGIGVRFDDAGLPVLTREE
jgi:hypothetical protein